MSAALKSLASRFGEHQKKFFAAGGRPRAIKYPRDWQAEAARLKGELKMPVAELARELGIGHSALQRWCERAKGTKAAPQPKKASFVPIEVMAMREPVPGRVGGPSRVTLREIAVDIDPHAGEATVAAIIAALAKSGRHEPC